MIIHNSYVVTKDINEYWEAGAKVGDVLTVGSWEGVPTLMKGDKAVCDLDSKCAKEHCKPLESTEKTNELTREQYQRQWESLNAAVNPKPSAEQRAKMLDGYQRERQARIRTQQMLKELNGGAVKDALVARE